MPNSRTLQALLWLALTAAAMAQANENVLGHETRFLDQLDAPAAAVVSQSITLSRTDLKRLQTAPANQPLQLNAGVGQGPGHAVQAL